MEEKPEWFKREDRDWDKIYSEYNLVDIPWHSERPDKELIELIEQGIIKPSLTLDVGCGSGTDAIYLASKGSIVTAIDISSEAIKIAEERAKSVRVKVNFIVGNFLELELGKECFDFINDRGCFHHINPLEREDFAGKINKVLKSNGLYYLRCWSDKEKSDKGPYKISKDIIKSIFSKYFDVGEIKDFRFSGKGERGYACLMRKMEPAERSE